jgi:CHAT domain-containing protein
MAHAPHANIDLIRGLIHAVDDLDLDTIAACTAQDVHFRFGNAAPTDTQSELLEAARSFRGAITDQRHTILDIWAVDDSTVIALMDVYYRRRDDRELNLPCCNVFRIHNGIVDAYLIFMDANPVTAP